MGSWRRVCGVLGGWIWASRPKSGESLGNWVCGFGESRLRPVDNRPSRTSGALYAIGMCTYAIGMKCKFPNPSHSWAALPEAFQA